MDQATLAGFRARIEARLAEIAAEEASTAETRRPVELDQQSVGRLSRIDAMQAQQMANAQSRRRATEKRRLEGALARIAEGEFGWCADCGEAIAPKRLELDPGHALCVRCASGG